MKPPQKTRLSRSVFSNDYDCLYPVSGLMSVKEIMDPVRQRRRENKLVPKGSA